MQELTNIIREKKKLSQRYKKKIQKKAILFNSKVDDITKRFEIEAEKITKEQEKKTRLLIKQYNKSLNSIAFEKRFNLMPALRNKVRKEICEYYGFEVADIDNPRGERTKVECRQVIYYFLVHHQLGTLKEIGETMRCKPPSVLHGAEVIESFLDVDNTFRANFNNIKEIIQDIMDESVNYGTQGK